MTYIYKYKHRIYSRIEIVRSDSIVRAVTTLFLFCLNDGFACSLSLSLYKDLWLHSKHEPKSIEHTHTYTPHKAHMRLTFYTLD